MADFGEQFFIDVVRNANNADPWSSTVNFDSWKRSVLHHLVKIASSKAGMALLRAIRRTGAFCAVVPPSPEIARSCNSKTWPLAATPVDVASPSKHRKYVAVVEFDPSQYVSGSACFRNKHLGSSSFNRAALPDEVLFHELFHALRNRTGHALGGALAPYNNSEEFLAVVMTNIYISDATNRSKSGLRGDHETHRPLDANLSTSLTFFRSSPKVLGELRQFVADKDMRQFCEELCGVKAAFNPIAAMMDTSIAPLLGRLSRSELSRNRDALAPIAFPILRMFEPSSPEPELIPALKGLGEVLAAEALKVLRS